MAAYQYQLLKCEGCGKTLGYIYISLKRSYLMPLLYPRYWPVYSPGELEKTAYCETCFQKRVEEATGIKQESEVTKESTETRTKSRERSLIR